MKHCDHCGEIKTPMHSDYGWVVRHGGIGGDEYEICADDPETAIASICRQDWHNWDHPNTIELEIRQAYPPTEWVKFIVVVVTTPQFIVTPADEYGDDPDDPNPFLLTGEELERTENHVKAGRPA